jgi:hypothetical protein
MRSTRAVLIGGAAAMVAAIGMWTTLPAWGQADRPAMIPHYGQPSSQPSHMTLGVMMDSAAGQTLANDIATARLATAKYATNLARAKADGYQILTKMMPNMGFHFINPKIGGFNVRKPQILVYERHGKTWQLGALEWVFTKIPKNPPLPFATFGTFPAACHYKDGTFVVDEHATTCPKKAPKTGAAFNFWHPDLVTMHVWVWYPNRAGLYSSTNPDITPFNAG